jgi:hypothetical protein
MDYELMGVLSGYRVLDCSIAMAGPFAAQRLGDLGAELRLNPLLVSGNVMFQPVAQREILSMFHFFLLIEIRNHWQLI